ncbi:MAG: phosphoenolpyruvate--protein phosphotransferase [Oligoflexia bacterium]|nr:phosphoenolpyruvate--protein phosphotransferase [Oligoflexia bacterium]
MLEGIVASPGVALARALVIAPREFVIERKTITAEKVEWEQQRFLQAVEKSKRALEEISEHTRLKIGEKEAAIFEAHLLLLSDPELINKTKEEISGSLVNAEYAFDHVSAGFVALFDAMEDEYMRERALDIRDITKRVLGNLLGEQPLDLSLLREETVIVAHDLTPSEFATIDKERLVGIITEIGGKTSHTAIMANSLEIAAVVGINNATDRIKSGDFLVLNALGDILGDASANRQKGKKQGEVQGEVHINPDQDKINYFKKLKKQYSSQLKQLDCLKGLSSQTIDGHKVHIVANIASLDEVKSVLNYDGEGVGLFRTEFLYMGRSNWPSEEEMFNLYRTVLQAMNVKTAESIGQRTVIIRTLDIGGDKELPYLKIDKELNPFLGLRAVRLCLQRPEIFKPQLRALLRASVYGQLKIMFPMISSLKEFLDVRQIYDSVKGDLEREGLPYDKKVPLGIMIEIPSAALISDVLAKHVDFFSIGTNDLIQYTCAVDRLNQNIHDLYDPYHPAVLRLIQMVIRNGHQEGIEVGMCGSLAGKPELIPLLLGLGLDEFSMSPSQMLRARQIIRSINYSDSVKIAERVMEMCSSMSSSEDIGAYLRNLNFMEP